jgi:hypothetical protein
MGRIATLSEGKIARKSTPDEWIRLRSGAAHPVVERRTGWPPAGQRTWASHLGLPLGPPTWASHLGIPDGQPERETPKGHNAGIAPASSGQSVDIGRDRGLRNRGSDRVVGEGKKNTPGTRPGAEGGKRAPEGCGTGCRPSQGASRQQGNRTVKDEVTQRQRGSSSSLGSIQPAGVRRWSLPAKGGWIGEETTAIHNPLWLKSFLSSITEAVLDVPNISQPAARATSTHAKKAENFMCFDRWCDRSSPCAPANAGRPGPIGA